MNETNGGVLTGHINLKTINFAMKHKSKISRSIFQHVVEENKKLLRDIRIIAMEPGVKAILVRMKWRDKFRHNEAFNKMLTTCAKRYFKEHPEKLPQLKFKK